jgi:hypothetical protein
MEKKTKKRPPMEIMQPGQVNEFWETILRIRDAGDPRWNEFSHGFRYSVEMYERNKNQEPRAVAA